VELQKRSALAPLIATFQALVNMHSTIMVHVAIVAQVTFLGQVDP
jgi:hypothetical protein